MVEQLKGPMAAQGTALKQYLKDTLLPAYNQVKVVHGDLDDKGASASDYMRYVSLCTDARGVDLAFGAGLLAFDEVCKKVERIALRDEDELMTARAESQVRSPCSVSSVAPNSVSCLAQYHEDPAGPRGSVRSPE